MHLFVFDSVFVSSLAWECILHSQSFFSLATEEWTSPLSSSLSSSWHSGSLDLSFYFQFHSRFHFFGRSWVSFALAPIRVHSGIVSLSLRFRFRFKLGFHRIKNYQTTWLSLSFLLCRNPMMLTTTTMRATTMVLPKTLKYREEYDEQKIQTNCIEIEIWQSKKFDAYQISLRILSVGVFLKELGRCNWHTQTKF